MALEGPATILGGLPVWAVCWYTRGDGWSSDDDSGVDDLYWLTKRGKKGKLITSKSIWDRLDKDPYWMCNVVESVSDYVYHNQLDAEDRKAEERRFELLSENQGAS